MHFQPGEGPSMCFLCDCEKRWIVCTTIQDILPPLLATCAALQHFPPTVGKSGSRDGKNFRLTASRQNTKPVSREVDIFQMFQSQLSV